MDISEYRRQVDDIYQNAKGEEVERQILALLQQCQKEHGTVSPPCAFMHSELGTYYRWIGRHEISEKEFLRTVEILAQLDGGHGADYATALNNLAGTLRYLGRYQEAEELFQRCLTLYRNTVGKRHILYAAALNNLSLVYLLQDKLEQAEKLQVQAIDILRMLPDSKAELAASLCNLGELYRRMGRREEAEDNLQQALVLQETEGTDSPHYHTILNGLGLLYCDLGQKETACYWFRRAARAAAAHYGSDHSEYRAVVQRLKEIEGEALS